MTTGKGVLEIQVSGDNRGQNQDEGGRDLETKPQPGCEKQGRRSGQTRVIQNKRTKPL